MSINKYYIDCTKRRPTTTVNEYGKHIKSFTDYPIKGYMGSMISHDLVVANKNIVMTVNKFYCDNYEFNQGEVFEIYSMDRNTVHKNHHNKLKLKKIEGVKGG